MPFVIEEKITAYFFCCCMLLCPVVSPKKEIFPPCKCWIIYLLTNSQHCQQPVVKIYLCPDKCSSVLQRGYSLLPDMLLVAVPVYTAVNHQLPITFLHKTRLVFKSGLQKRDGDATIGPMPGAPGLHSYFSLMHVCVQYLLLQSCTAKLDWKVCFQKTFINFSFLLKKSSFLLTTD